MFSAKEERANFKLENESQLSAHHLGDRFIYIHVYTYMVRAFYGFAQSIECTTQFRNSYNACQSIDCRAFYRKGIFDSIGRI